MRQLSAFLRAPQHFTVKTLPVPSVDPPNQANPFCPGKDFETLATRVLKKGTGNWRPFCWMFSVSFWWFSHFSLINSHRFSRTICCKSFYPRHSLGGGIAKLVALQLPVQSRPMTIAFAAPGVQYSARVLLGHTSRDRNIQLRKRRGTRGLKNLDFVLVVLVWVCKKFAPPCPRWCEKHALGHFGLCLVLGRLDMEDEFTLDVIPRHDVVSQLDWTPSSALIAPCDATRLFQKVVDVSTKTRRIGWTLSEMLMMYAHRTRVWLLVHPPMSSLSQPSTTQGLKWYPIQGLHQSRVSIGPWTIVGPKKGIERYCYWKSIESLLCPSCLWIFVDASFTLQALASDLVTVHLQLYNFLFFPGCPPSLIAIAEMVSGCFMDFALELELLQPLQAMLQFP